MKGKDGSDTELGVTPHWFRHTRAIFLLRKHYSIIDVADALDHRSLDSTRQYLKISGVSNRKIMERDEPDW